MPKLMGVKINYMNGDSERIALSNVMQYDGLARSGEINPGFSIRGTGCNIDYVIHSVSQGKPLLIAREGGTRSESDIAKVINMHQVRDVEPVID